MRYSFPSQLHVHRRNTFVTLHTTFRFVYKSSSLNPDRSQQEQTNQKGKIYPRKSMNDNALKHTNIIQSDNDKSHTILS